MVLNDPRFSGPVRTRLTRFVWLCQNSRQILSPPNFEFANSVYAVENTTDRNLTQVENRSQEPMRLL